MNRIIHVIDCVCSFSNTCNVFFVGALRDLYGSYVQAYQLMASVTLVGATLFFFVPCLRKQEPTTETVIE